MTPKEASQKTKTGQVWICRFPLPLGVWEGLRFVIVALPGLSSYFCFLFHFIKRQKDNRNPKV